MSTNYGPSKQGAMHRPYYQWEQEHSPSYDPKCFSEEHIKFVFVDSVVTPMLDILQMVLENTQVYSSDEKELAKWLRIGNCDLWGASPPII